MYRPSVRGGEIQSHGLPCRSGRPTTMPMADGVARITELFRRALADYDMLTGVGRLLVAVSGGQDSLAMLQMLCELPPRQRPQLVVAHFNHHMRPEADADQQFVCDTAAALGCEYVTGGEAVVAYSEQHGLNLEVAGHRLRHEFFRQQADATHCDRIALGHTATDVAESLLMNLLRGAGIEGLASIAPTRERLIRPLIYLTREQTGHFCQVRGLQFRTDSTNLDADRHHRNHIRHHLMPLLERDYGPGVEQALLRAALAVRDELQWTEEHVCQALESCQKPSDSGLCLSVEAAAALPAGLLHRVLRKALSNSGAKVRTLRWEHWQSMANLIVGQSGSGQVDLPDDWTARREYDRFLVEPTRPMPRCPLWHESIRLAIPGETKLPDGRCVTIERHSGTPDCFPRSDEPCAVMDADAAGIELYLRQIKPGDRLVPLGMNGSKKVSDLLTDEKVPVHRRSLTLALVDADDRLLWLVGHRLSQLVAIGPSTTKHYRVHLTEPEVGPAIEAAPDSQARFKPARESERNTERETDCSSE